MEEKVHFVYELLGHLLSDREEIRKVATQKLKEVECQPGFCSLLVVRLYPSPLYYLTN